eukprot:CAMPEP_0183379350 /NCGR_PEP_ID=MMETSP0164_2-20130417/125382_1 /TAXON_ID=221442 /ORGANISM="Coccolithus pelagicus ssp braarudi, Strain PLY182g" /LENGTH=96 /DNA_ID=CAMNT_0025556931 /DNA_START=274 /DNA_END=565 /DNA_ORIENTATION=+
MEPRLPPRAHRDTEMLRLTCGTRTPHKSSTQPQPQMQMQMQMQTQTQTASFLYPYLATTSGPQFHEKETRPWNPAFPHAHTETLDAETHMRHADAT